MNELEFHPDYVIGIGKFMSMYTSCAYLGGAYRGAYKDEEFYMFWSREPVVISVKNKKITKHDTSASSDLWAVFSKIDWEKRSDSIIPPSIEDEEE